jgi:Tol biopolymer transport system component
MEATLGRAGWLFVTASLGTLVLAPAAAAAPRIAFTDQDGSGILQIVTTRPDGTDRHQVTHFKSDVVEEQPSWSPRHRFIVFTRAPADDGPQISHLYLVRPDGTQLRRIANTRNADSPSWSPRGSRIAFEQNGAIYTIGVRGKHRKRVTASKHNIQPDWGPKGRALVYDSPKGIVRMHADGSHKVLVFRSGSLSAPKGAQPAWSHDGTRIAFVYTGAGGGTSTDIYTISPNGTDMQNVTESRPFDFCPGNEVAGPCERQDIAPAWRPSGTALVFTEGSGGLENGVFTITIRTHESKRISIGGQGPDW